MFKNYLYWFVALGELIALLFDIELLHQICKPLLMLSLLIYFWSKTEKRKNENWAKFVTLALVFSWIGDIMLMFTNINFLLFFAGLSSFLIAHIVYMFAYYRATYQKRLNIHLSAVPFIFLVYFGILAYLILPYIDAVIQVPLTVYAVILFLMVSAAFFRKGVTPPMSFQYTFAGSILFIVSDSLLAINRFSETIPYASVAVMATYIVAQWLIVRGLLNHRPE